MRGTSSTAELVRCLHAFSPSPAGIARVARCLVSWRPAGFDEMTRLHHSAHYVMLAHHLGLVAVGLLGIFLAPSPSVAVVLGGKVATYLWSSGLLMFGLMGVLSRWVWATGAELWAVAGTAVAGAFWAAFIVAGLAIDNPPAAGGPVNYGSLQTAAMLLMGAIFRTSWVLWTLSYLRAGAPPVNADRISDVARAVERIRDDGGLSRGPGS